MEIDRFLELPRYQRQYITFVKDELLLPVISNDKRNIDQRTLDTLAKSVAFAVANLMLLPIGFLGLPLISSLIIRGWSKIRKDRISRNFILVVPTSFSDKLTLPPGHPHHDSIVYVCHPVDGKTYAPAFSFHRIMFEHKVKELLILLTHLGAKHIEIYHDHGWDKQFAGKLVIDIPPVRTNSEINTKRTHRKSIMFETDLDNPLEPSIPSDLVWYPFESMWQAVAEMRIKGKQQTFKVTLNYADEFGVDTKFAASVPRLNLELGGKFFKLNSTLWTFRGNY
jgi:hypothetical protein